MSIWVLSRTADYSIQDAHKNLAEVVDNPGFLYSTQTRNVLALHSSRTKLRVPLIVRRAFVRVLQLPKLECARSARHPGRMIRTGSGTIIQSLSPGV